MLNRIKNLLNQPVPTLTEKPAVIDLTLAICILLLEVARADDEFTSEERENIIMTMQKHFSLTAEESEDLIHSAAEAREESLDLWKFSNRVNNALSREQKGEIMEGVWRIIYADGTLDSHEDYFVHKLANLLNLTHKDMIAAKLTVLKEIRSS